MHDRMQCETNLMPLRDAAAKTVVLNPHTWSWTLFKNTAKIKEGVIYPLDHSDLDIVYRGSRATEASFFPLVTILVMKLQ